MTAGRSRLAIHQQGTTDHWRRSTIYDGCAPTTLDIPLYSANRYALHRPAQGHQVALGLFRALSDAIQASKDLLARAPSHWPITSVLQQLEAIRTWTEDGRDPTQEERWKPRIGLALLRAFETEADDQIVTWGELSKEVEGYFRHWLDDAAYQTADDDELPDFPEEEDEQTHLRL